MDQPAEPHAIFDNDLLLDTILEYVVQDKGKVKIFDVKQSRLVNKAFLRSISRTLHKYKTPFFHLFLHEEKHTNGRNVLKKENELVRFITPISPGNLHLGQRIPFYTIKNVGSGPQPNTCEFILNCLKNCGNQLMALDLRLSELQVFFPPNNNLSLPMLNKFTVEMSRECMLGAGDVNDMSDKINFMQSVFDASPHLKIFMLGDVGLSGNVVPEAFGSLKLAASITQLYLTTPLKECHLQTLISSCLPNLTSLAVSLRDSPARDGIITRILEKLKKKLENLSLSYEAGVNQEEGPVTYKLPLMEKLKYLHIDNMYPSCDMEEHGSSLADLVPMLSHMRLHLQNKSVLRRWAENVCLPSVTSVKVSMAYDGEGAEVFKFFRCGNVDQATMQALHLGLRNVTKLNITQGTTNLSALVFVMREMRGLQSLKITVQNGGRLARRPHLWDAILVGIPQDKVAALEQSPGLWEGLQAASEVSIRNLTELQKLELYTPRESICSVITNIAFIYGFSKMPKLTYLALHGGFWISRVLARIWESDGRTIESDFGEDEIPTTPWFQLPNLDHEDESESDGDDDYEQILQFQAAAIL